MFSVTTQRRGRPKPKSARQEFRADGSLSDGDRIVIMGEDIDGKTDDLGDIGEDR